MSLLDGLKSLFQSDDEVEQVEKASPVEYCEWLIKFMLQTGKTELTLDSRQPVPGAEETDEERKPPSLPELESIINRLKYLSGLNPVFCAEPKSGAFERNRSNHLVLVKTHFEDSDQRSLCRLSLSIRIA